MKLTLADLTSVAAVQAALDEFARLGQVAFLELHGFGPSRDYLVRNPVTGDWADSKAIAGVALGYQHPGSGGLKAKQFSGGERTVQARLSSLGFEVMRIGEVEGTDWTREEVALVVADYLAMLTCEMTGQAFSKTAHREALLRRLPGRSSGSIEFKHANVSAAMIELGFPYVRGYKPRSNFQRGPLLNEISMQVERFPLVEEAALLVVQRPATVVQIADFAKVRSEAPRANRDVREPLPAYAVRAFRRDYLEREARNRSLGEAGEVFAVQFERWRLAAAGMGQLADQVKHVAKDEGDGLGFDIRSYETDGRERFIEVKTTSFGDRTPFFVSANELRFARGHAEAFRLYRLFDFRSSPRLFELTGPVEGHCLLDPISYRASFC